MGCLTTHEKSDFAYETAQVTFNFCNSGPEINFFGQVPTGDQNFFSVAKWKNLVPRKCR